MKLDRMGSLAACLIAAVALSAQGAGKSSTEHIR
jgi:hypothetical protein